MSCSGGACVGGARRRPPPPPEPTLSLATELGELSLDQGYHTLADCGPPRRTIRKDNTLSDALWLHILSYIEAADLCRMSRVCRRWARLVSRLCARPSTWRRIRAGAGGYLEEDARGAGVRAGPCAIAAREWRSKSCAVSVTGAQLLAATFHRLTHLSIAISNIDARALAPLITDLPELRHIDLTGCSNVNWPEWAWLEGRLANRRPPIEYVDLTDCCAVNDGGLCALLHTCPGLQYLYLRRCILVTDASIRWIPSYCCSLKELSVSDCTGVTDFGLYELAKLGQGLRYLSIAKCTQVSDSGVRAIARRCYRLRYMNARGCNAIGDEGAAALARGCSRLRALDLGATDIADAGLQLLAHCCPNLKKLGLRGCELISNNGLEAVAYYCRGLTQLNIQDTPINISGYRAVKKYCKRCVIEHTNPGFC